MNLRTFSGRRPLVFLLIGWLCGLALSGPVDLRSAEPDVPAAESSLIGDKLDDELADSPWRERTLDAVEKAAGSGDAEAQLELARRYGMGEGVAVSRERCLQLVRAVAEGGSPMGQYLLGFQYANEWPQEGTGEITGNYQLAAEWYARAATQGHLEAALELGELYGHGQLPRDTGQARRWLRVAADAGDRRAARLLAFELSQPGVTASGEELPSDPAQAIRWYQVAIQKGDRTAPTDLAALLLGLIDTRDPKFRPDPVLARQWLKKAGPENLGAVAWLAFYFDDESAARSVNLEQLQNEGNAHYGGVENLLIARCYERGWNVPRDPNRAVAYYRRGLQHTESSPAMMTVYAALIRLYDTDEVSPGPGRMPPELPSQPELVPVASDRLRLAELYWKGTRVVPANRSNAVEWYLRAAQAGSAPAMRRLAELWASAELGNPDPAEAARWMREAEKAEKAKVPQPKDAK